MSGVRDIDPKVGGKSEATRARIIEVAARLFASDGYDAVTTQRISREAGIAAGTLFRYAGTKSELLLLVLNDRFAEAIDDGIRAAAALDDPAAALAALADPVIAFAAAQGENTAHYQRALLYGPSGEPHRDRGRALVGAWRDAAAGVLARTLDVAAGDPMPRLAAETAFAALSLAVTDVTQSRGVADLHAQFDLITSGLSIRRSSTPA